MSIETKEEMELYFELKNSPASSRESYMRRVLAFTKFIESQGVTTHEF